MHAVHGRPSQWVVHAKQEVAHVVMLGRSVTVYYNKLILDSNQHCLRCYIYIKPCTKFEIPSILGYNFSNKHSTALWISVNFMTKQFVSLQVLIRKTIEVIFEKKRSQCFQQACWVWATKDVPLLHLDLIILNPWIIFHAVIWYWLSSFMYIHKWCKTF